MKTATSLGMLLLLSSSAHAINITTCYQTVPVRQTGVLQADLVCDDNDIFNLRPGVTIERGGRLDLNGHTITMGSAANDPAVHCVRFCRVRDSSVGATGRLIGGSGDFAGVGVSGYVVRVDDVDIDGFGAGIQAHRVHISNVAITGADVYGIRGERVTILGSSISACAAAIVVGLKITAKDSTISNNSAYGIDTGQILNGVNLTVLNNGATGIDAIAGNNNHGGQIKLRNSQVLGHTVDLKAAARPILRNTTCGTSEAWDRNQNPLGTSWGVCAND